MAAIYDSMTGDVITDGLQGCNVRDAAILAAHQIADERGTDVTLYDDDGCWMIHPATNGHREAADILDKLPVESEDDDGHREADDFIADDLVVCESADGWSLHAPGSTDTQIVNGDAPPLADGPWPEGERIIPNSAYDEALAELARR